MGDLEHRNKVQRTQQRKKTEKAREANAWLETQGFPLRLVIDAPENSQADFGSHYQWDVGHTVYGVWHESVSWLRLSGMANLLHHQRIVLKFANQFVLRGTGLTALYDFHTNKSLVISDSLVYEWIGQPPVPAELPPLPNLLNE